MIYDYITCKKRFILDSNPLWQTFRNKQNSNPTRRTLNCFTAAWPCLTWFLNVDIRTLTSSHIFDKTRLAFHSLARVQLPQKQWPGRTVHLQTRPWFLAPAASEKMWKESAATNTALPLPATICWKQLPGTHFDCLNKKSNCPTSKSACVPTEPYRTYIIVRFWDMHVNLLSKAHSLEPRTKLATSFGRKIS